MKLTKEIIDKIQEAMLHTKKDGTVNWKDGDDVVCLLYTSPSPRDPNRSRMPSSA